MVMHGETKLCCEDEKDLVGAQQMHTVTMVMTMWRRLRRRRRRKFAMR